MINSTSLPSSVAEPLDDLDEFTLSERYHAITFTEYIDEKTLFTDINKKLKKLETSTDIEDIELETIVRLTEQINIAKEEKEEALTRIDWLQRLYKAKVEMEVVDTKEKLKMLRQVIAPVQTCPLKIQLLAEIDSREASILEKVISKKPTEYEWLMENAINEAGDVFINLGKAGREFVIAEVMKREGDQANTAHIQTLAGQVEHRVLSLLQGSDRAEMIAELDQLPLSVFSSLQDLKKEKIVDTLITEKGWTGLFSLERIITQISSAIDREEREKYEKENVIDLPEGKAAATLDLRYNPID